MQATSPINKTPQSPISRSASPRPPLHPRTQLTNIDSPRSRAASPTAGNRRMSGSPPATPSSSSGLAGLGRTNSVPDATRNLVAVARRRSSTLSFDQPRMVSRVKLPKENTWSLFWSMMGLIVFFGGALVIAAITQMGMSMNWLYNGSQFPIISCPSSTFLVGASENIDGSHCKLLFAAGSSNAILSVDPRAAIIDSGNLGYVVYSTPCNVATSLINQGKCSFSAWSDFYPEIPTGSTSCLYNLMPVCDPNGSVSVGHIITLRGLAATAGVILVLYFFILIFTFVRVKATVTPSRERRLEGSRNQAEECAREMSRIVEKEWSVLEPHSSSFTKRNSRSSPNRFERGTIGGESTPANARELFTSTAWKYKVTKSLGTEARARRNVVLLLQKLRTGVTVWGIFFALHVGLMTLLIYVLPSNYYTYTSRSVVSAFVWNHDSLGDSVKSSSAWIDFIAIADLGTEFVLLLFSILACGIIQWPNQLVKVPHIVKVRGALRRGSEVDFSQAAADGAIYAETIGAVLLVRENCTSEHRKHSLVKRIQNLLTMFPPESIFVVDSHGQSVTPVDSTWETVYGISPAITYCFVPETDSKIFSLYWFTAIWFPFLVKSGKSQNLSHFLVIASSDDDGGILPLLPSDLTLPRENLLHNRDSLRALHLPVSAASGSHNSSSCCWVPWQDFDMKFKAIRRLAESRLGSASEVELNISVWEREALVRTLGSATSRDTASPLQNMQRGLGVVKLRGMNHIKSVPFSFINVCVASKFTDIVTWRFRNNFAGDVVKAGCALRELFSVFSLCNVYSWSIKLFLLLGTLVSGVCQLMRPFVIGSLVFRDPLAIGCLAAVALVVIVFLEILLFMVFSSRSDLRQKWHVGSILSYPVYRAIKCWLIEVPSLFEYIMGGSVRNASIQPEKRVRDLQDVPACPPCHVVNWFTVWRISDEEQITGKAKRDELEDTMSSIGEFR